MTEAFPQLCFTLAAPFGAWGAASPSSATTAWKATDLDPPKSAIVGLLGAALGCERAALGGLAGRLRLAVRTGIRPEREPRPDFHTIARARRPEGRHRWSRFEELRGALAGQVQDGALLSRREYWSCGLWSVALDGPAELLAQLKAALRTPRWALHAGRRSCTLGLPPDPRLVTAPGPMAALEAYGWPWDRRPELHDLLKGLKARMGGAAASGELAADADYPGLPRPALARQIRRRDLPDPQALPGGRIYQRFAERVELRLPWPPSPDAKPEGTEP
ncbi:MAG TPA: type I-E CRISPR-associated protein Cas5/CasD [Alphaproteobacteria bacterium]|nr:type I-E CRISPR-associated protein Cas5/CasD [Alphaproteobacteria bacterium]